MENKILNSILTNLHTKENKSLILKPLNKDEKTPSGINTGDSLVKKFSNAVPVLINPIRLFLSEKKSNDEKSGNSPQKLMSPLLLFQNITPVSNISIIEPGSSIENINALKQFTGKVWLGRSPSNGNREAAIIIPEGVDYNKPFELIYYFHGHNGQISKSLTDPDYGLKDQIKNMAKDRNIIVVVPQGPPKSLDYTWMNGNNKENMQQFENDTVNIIKTQLDPRVQISSITVKGHSAGGRPIMNSAAEGRLIADRIDFLDASYGTWASQTYNNFIKTNPDAKFNLIYIPGTGTQDDALGLKGKNGVNLIKSNVGHSSIPKQFFSV